MLQFNLPGCRRLRCLVLFITSLSFLFVGCVAMDPQPVQVEPVMPSVENKDNITEEPLQAGEEEERPIPSSSPEIPQEPSPPLQLEAEEDNVETILQANLTEEDDIEAILQASLTGEETNSEQPSSAMSPEDIISHYETEQQQSKSESSYTLRPGDVIEISVQGEDLTREIIIPPDGTISFFLIGQIQVNNMSIENVRLEVEELISETLPSSTVIIRGKSLVGGAAEALGAVNLPGYKLTNQGDRISDLLAKAGGLWDFSFYGDTDEPEIAADPGNAYFARNGNKLAIDLVGFLEDGLMEKNPEIKPGDFIYIPRRHRQGVQIIGEVNQPINLNYRQDLTVQDAVSLAGGIRQNIFGKDIFLIRGSLNNLEVMRLSYQAIINGIEEDIPLLSGDILFAPRTFILDLSKLPLLFLPKLDILLRSGSEEGATATY